MRGAGPLYRLHLALATFAAALLAGGAALAIARHSLAVPSTKALTDACQKCGGPISLLGFSVAALALVAVVRGAGSIRRQLRATRRYLAGQRMGKGSIDLAGVRCRLIDYEEPRAFCAGYLRPQIYLSRGARDGLEPAELRAVLAHEEHHRRRRDPLRLLAAYALADALFFIPILRKISYLGELAADEAAVRTLGGRGPLASALLKFSEATPSTAAVVSLAPERVDHLMGDPDATRWGLPRSLLAPSAIALAGLGAASLLRWRGVLGPDLQVPLLLGTICAGIMVFGPATLAIAAIAFSRQAQRRHRRA